MSNKAQKLKELAMQAHIDNELDKSSLYTPHAVHPATSQHRNTENENYLSNKNIVESIEELKPSNYQTPQHCNTANPHAVHPVTPQQSSTSIIQNFKIKKTIYLDEDLHNIIKFIKFSQKIDETKFIGIAIENYVIEMLGENWKIEYKQYLKND